MKNKIISVITGTLTAIFTIGVILVLSMILANTVKENSNLDVDSTYYQGHTMLIYTKGTSVSVVHSPTCKKCFQVYD